MSDELPVEKFHYNDGCVKQAGYVYIANKLKTLDPYEYSFGRLVMYKAPNWAFHDVGWDVISVCYWEHFDMLVALGEWGQIHVATKQGGREDGIADVKNYSPVSQVRQIGSRLHVCGGQGQVYRLDGADWVHIDSGLLTPELSSDALGFNGIDGTSEEDVFVVGFRGKVFHFNGSIWTEIDSKTNQHLERVHCVKRGETYICGARGTFLRITSLGVEDFSLQTEEGLWGLCSLEGKVFVAGDDRLYLFNGSELEPITTGLEPLSTYRLDARDGQLWSFGADDIAYFDGTTWTRIIDPDNA
jgi:hypothetical protein